jgi:hypothetical protein
MLAVVLVAVLAAGCAAALDGLLVLLLLLPHPAKTAALSSAAGSTKRARMAPFIRASSSGSDYEREDAAWWRILPDVRSGYLAV